MTNLSTINYFNGLQRGIYYLLVLVTYNADQTLEKSKNKREESDQQFGGIH